MSGTETPNPLPDWGLEPPQWTDEPGALGDAPAAGAADAAVDAVPAEPDADERLTWRGETESPWSLDEDGPPPGVIGG